jgi:hypothetical protein
VVVARCQVEGVDPIDGTSRLSIVCKVSHDSVVEWTMPALRARAYGSHRADIPKEKVAEDAVRSVFPWACRGQDKLDDAPEIIGDQVYLGSQPAGPGEESARNFVTCDEVLG